LSSSYENNIFRLHQIVVNVTNVIGNIRKMFIFYRVA